MTNIRESIKSTDENVSMECETNTDEHLNFNEDELLDENFIIENPDYEVISRLKSIYINLPFTPPPSHMCETCISRPPSQDVRDKIEQFGVEIKVGSFNPAEDKIIIKNWESFSKEYMFDDPTVFFSLKKMKRVERIKFAQYLGCNLPNRYLYSIVLRFINLFQQKISGKFDEHTDEILLKHMEKHEVIDFIGLSKILGRDKYCIYRRCQLLKQLKANPEFKNRTKWDYKLIEKLLKSLLRICNIDDITVLKNKTIQYSTWCDVEKACGIPAMRAKNFWLRKLHTQLFAVNIVTYNEIVIKLIDIFSQGEYKYLEDVKWKDFLNHFDDDGLTSSFLYYRWVSLVKQFVPREKRRKLRKTVKILQRRRQSIQNSENFTLQRLRYKKNEGLILIEDNL